jgi:DNA-binding transcriptional regulator YdaS (Cro superfamily)
MQALKNYLEKKRKKKLTQAGFADLVDVEAATVSRWLAGKRKPRPAEALKIVAVTKGKVTLQDIYR